MPSKTLKLPINIVAAKGAYCVEMEVGSQQQKVKLVLDTGSSTIALETKKYKPEKDFYLQATSYAQAITYGSGGWAGPLIETHLQLEHQHKKMTLKNGHIAIIESEQQDNFYGADGILGLAYRYLNKAYDLTDYYQKRNAASTMTYPWIFEIEENKQAVRKFKKFLKGYPSIKPKAFFTELEERKIARNKFSLYVKRSIVHVADQNVSDEQLEADPLNQGWLILGSGEEHKELYQGKLEIIDVVHDAYYNTKLHAMQVGDQGELVFPQDNPNRRKAKYSNSIIDSGSSYVVLQENLYQELLDQLLELDTNFIRHINAFEKANSKEDGYQPTDLNLAQWPDVHFYFKGETPESLTKVTCTPEHYWQLNALKPGRAWFMFLKEVKGIANKSIFGLPLISDYFCIFDREHDKNGVIKVGKIKD